MNDPDTPTASRPAPDTLEEPETDTAVPRAERPDDREEAGERAHLAGIGAGCGCVEVWEHLSDRRGE